MKTEIKLINGDLCLIVPEIFVKPLQWHKGDTIDIKLVDGTLLMSKF